jgi:putative transposase
MLNAEMDHHLAQGDEDGGRSRGNHRNGYSKKILSTDTAKLEIEIPRDREGTCDGPRSFP